MHNAWLVLLVSSDDYIINLDNYVMGSNCYVPKLACTKKNTALCYDKGRS